MACRDGHDRVSYGRDIYTHCRRQKVQNPSGDFRTEQLRRCTGATGSSGKLTVYTQVTGPQEPTPPPLTHTHTARKLISTMLLGPGLITDESSSINKDCRISESGTRFEGRGSGEVVVRPADRKPVGEPEKEVASAPTYCL